MNSLKIGIIGIFILLPFLFVSSVAVRHQMEAKRRDAIVENVSARALRDGVFALKTYSTFSYEEEKARLKIAEKEVEQVILDSFAFGLNGKTMGERERITRNLKLIGFIAFDRIILRDLQKGERMEIPFRENIKKDGKWYFENLDLIEDNKLPAELRKVKVSQRLQETLERFMGKGMVKIPEHTSTLFGRDYAEVGVFLVVQGDPLNIGQEKSYLKMGKVSLSERKFFKPE